MKILFIVSLVLLTSKTYSQIDKFEYFDFDTYEVFEIKPDSFVYKHSCGLMYGTITGIIERKKDTLILNSGIQPFYSLKKSYNPLLNSDSIAVTIKNIGFPNHFGLRVHKGIDYKELDVPYFNMFPLENDSIENSYTHYISLDSLSPKEKLKFILYRTNLRIEIDWTDSEVNQFEIVFKELPDVVDYHFFTNKKGILKKNNLILFDEKGKPEMTLYTVRRKKMITLSKKKRIKKYKKST